MSNNDALRECRYPRCSCVVDLNGSWNGCKALAASKPEPQAQANTEQSCERYFTVANLAVLFGVKMLPLLQRLKDAGHDVTANQPLTKLQAAALLAADKAGGEMVSIEENTFVRGWLNLEKFPGVMMVSNDGPYGPIPASTTCWITTSERERDYQLAKGEPMLEVWAIHPHPQPSALPDDVVKDAAMLNWMLEHIVTGSIGFGDWWISADESASEWKSALRAAMLKEGKA